MEGVLFVWKLKTEGSLVHLKKRRSSLGVSYLWGELEHRSANDERRGVVFGGEGERVRPIHSPQTAVSQNRLRTDDDLQRERRRTQQVRTPPSSQLCRPRRPY